MLSAHSMLVSGVIAVTFAISATHAHAKDKTDLDKSPVGEDASLYACGKARGKVAVSFKPDVKLKDLVSWAMGFTCKNFVYNSAIAGRTASATIIVPRKMTAKQAWRVFLVSLQTMGLTVVPKGNVLEILESAQVGSGALPLYLKSLPSSSDQVVRKIFRPENVSADDLATALSMLKSKHGAVKALSVSGIVVVTDFGNHIVKMSTMAKEVDRAGIGERLYAVAIRRVDAAELAKKLEEILGPADNSHSVDTRGGKRRSKAQSKGARAGSGSTAAFAPGSSVPSRIVADERTNTIFVVATERAFSRVRAIVDRLELEIEGDAAGTIHLYDLENADAEDVATTLSSVLGAISSGKAPTAGRRSKPATSQPAIQGQVRVAADKTTNALVVVASTRDYLALSQIIRRLDAPRRQVYIEAMVFEVSADTTRQLGVSFHGGKGKGGNIFMGGVQHKGLKSALPADALSQNGIVGGAIGPPLPNAKSLLGTTIPSFGLMVQALATTGNIDVLSTPHILTADNEQATLSVGENIPFKSGLSSLPSATGDGTSPFSSQQSIERQKVALTLTVTPHINSENLIRFDIDLQIEDVASPDFQGLGPSWATRSVKNTVVVHDQETIVIGGLMSNRLEVIESKVPILGDVPLLGHLFKRTERKKRKTNLLILLTPHLINDRLDSRRVLDRRMRERTEFLDSMGSLRKMKYNSSIDYRRKRGLVEEINRTVARFDREKAELEELTRSLQKDDDRVTVITGRD